MTTLDDEQLVKEKRRDDSSNVYHTVDEEDITCGPIRVKCLLL